MQNMKFAKYMLESLITKLKKKKDMTNVFIAVAHFKCG